MPRYGRCADVGDFEEFGNVFDEDGTSEFSSPSISKTLVGRPEIRESCRAAMANYTGRQHVLNGLDFEVNGDVAKGSGTLIFYGVLKDSTPDNFVEFGGHYRWTFRRTAAGWKVKTQNLSVFWNRART